jgi:diguanylate cyclase (GGDEF)-like protein
MPVTARASNLGRLAGMHRELSGLTRRTAIVVALALAYFVAGKLGLRLLFVNPSATAVWPPTGIALAALLVLGYRVWPGILLGAFLLNVTTGTLATSLAIAAGNTLAALVGAFLINRYANGRWAMQRGVDVLTFAGLGALVAPAVSATVSVTALAVAGAAGWSGYGAAWLTWGLADATGALIVAPPLLEWSTRYPHRRRASVRSAEAVALLIGLLLVTVVVFGGLLRPALRNAPLGFVCTPFLLWAALRFGRRATATALLLMSVVAAWGTLQGLGPFGAGTRNGSLLLLQAFLGVTAVTMLVLAAEVAARRDDERRLRHLAVSDPLTGLANYRRLVSVVEAEIVRAQRTERSFTILFLDVDDLKGVNDRYGHLLGSRALVRVAEVLSLTCRAMDTAARYGGDEFALVLPETVEADARQVATRVSKGLAADGEQPPLSVSVGVSEYPRDGGSVESLIGRADRLLYDEKARLGRRVSSRP